MSNGLFLTVLASALIHASWNIAAKRAGGNFGILWAAQLLAALLMLPFALWAGNGSLLPHSLAGVRYIAVTATIQALYFFLLSRAYKSGDISVVYPIARGCGVAGTALCAALLAREALSLIGIVGIVAICIGAVALGQPQTPPSRPQETRASLRYAIAIGFTLSASATNDKFAVGVIDPLIYVFWMFFLASMEAAPVVLRTHRDGIKQAYTTHRKTTVIVGIGSLGGYLIILFAFKTGPLAYIAALREVSVLLGALYGFAVLKERFTLLKALGLTAILTGLVLIKLA